ncbi:MAG: histidinol-phosphate transaminase [Bacillota bacterium]
MYLTSRRGIEQVERCLHGGVNRAEVRRHGLDPAAVLDFSSNINPLGPPFDVARLLEVDLAAYPDPAAEELRGLLAARHRVDVGQVFLGNGTAEIIRLLALAYLERGDRMLVMAPTFGEYACAARIAGAEVISCFADEDRAFAPDLDAMAELIRRCRPRMVFLCNPNNPTGYYLGATDFAALLQQASGLIVLDEAYVNFVEGAWPSERYLAAGNLMVLRSMTKDYALAGLRLGYALGPREVVRVLERVAPPWNVNAFAQRAGVLALQSDGDYLARMRSAVRQSIAYLRNGLRQRGFSPLKTRANFFLLPVGNAAVYRERLLERGILVRDCASFGLPAYIRIAARPLNECHALLEALQDIANVG